MQQRFIIWKASEYQTIKQIEDAIQNNNNSAKLSKQLRVLREQYFDWLVSIESDKFRALESVGVPVSLAKSSSNSNRDESLDDYSNEEVSQDRQLRADRQQTTTTTAS